MIQAVAADREHMDERYTVRLGIKIRFAHGPLAALPHPLLLFMIGDQPIFVIAFVSKLYPAL